MLYQLSYGLREEGRHFTTERGEGQGRGPMETGRLVASRGGGKIGPFLFKGADMTTATLRALDFGTASMHANLPVPRLVELALARGEA